MEKMLKAVICFCLMGVAACGYHLEGGGFIGDNVGRVAVRFFENNTSETGAAMVFTNALAEEIVSKTDTRIVDENQADAILSARINTIVFSVLSRATTDNVTERKVTAAVDVKMVSADGKIIWAVDNFTSTEDYTVSDNKVADEANKKDAIDKIAVRVAERLVSRMLTNF